MTIGGNIQMGGGVAYSESWSERVRQTTLAVGTIDKDGAGTERFVTGAAAVLVRDKDKRLFIATALHVFENVDEKWFPTELRIRGWRDEKKSRYADLGSVLTLKKDGERLFAASKQFDLAVIPATQEIVMLIG